MSGHTHLAEDPDRLPYSDESWRLSAAKSVLSDSGMPRFGHVCIRLSRLTQEFLQKCEEAMGI